MGRALETTDLSHRAAAQALDAAAAAGVDVRNVHAWDEIKSVCELFDTVWGTRDYESLLQAGMLRALVHSGNYAAGAYVDGELCGAVMGFFGREDAGGPGASPGMNGAYLHSHILGVSVGHRGGNVGFALKQHQRAWALDHGIRRVTWTFDPLVRRNAYFNFHKLGASAAEYLVRFYGSMTDSVNAGDETDRLLIDWELDSPNVDLAASHRREEPNVAFLRGNGAVVALSDSARVNEDASARVLLCATPDDIVDLRGRDPELARRWRGALRDTLGAALNDGYQVTGFTRSGWYVLERS